MIKVVTSVFVAIALASCASAPPPSPAEPQAVRVTMTTTGGTFKLILFPQFAPQTVAQFVRLARAGVYDSVYFFRVEKGFVAQAAAWQDREIPLNGEQMALIHNVPLEASVMLHSRGVLSLAHGDDPDSGETSFSILLGEARHLDGKYTVFGMIEDGEETLQAIEKAYDAHAKNADGERLQILKMTVGK